MKQNIKPISTNINQVIIFNNKIVILEDYYDFKGISNLYCLNFNNKIIWSAEITSNNDVYTNSIIINDDNSISCSTWSGHNNKINLDNGKIIDVAFTK